MLPKKIAFVDLETTGGRVTYDRVIEIGIVRVEEGIVTKEYNTLLNPGIHVPPFIESLTGISSPDLENAPSFFEVKEEVKEILNDCVFVAHNVRFDYGFLKNEFRRLNDSFSPKHFCTVRLSQYLFPQFSHHNLDSIIERFGFTCEKRHRAFHDAKILWQFVQAVQKQIPEEQFTKAINFVLKKPSTPLNLSREVLDSLPESPGVYIFYGKEETPLYIGKSINIKERVLSHFVSDHSSGTEMSIAQQIRHIETIQTSGELGALFREATLIKKLQPVYNRKLRLKRRLIVLKKRETKEGYSTVDIEELNTINVNDLDSTMGIFRSRKQAKEFLVHIAKEHKLCQKLFSIEKAKKSCFGYHLGWCKGACKGKENPAVYNARFIVAFSDHKIKSWPFNGPIMIEEKNSLDDEYEQFIVDKWCFLGSIKSSSDLHEITNDYIFDLDAYKILVSYIFSLKNQPNIKVLKDNSPFLTSEVSVA